MKTKQPLTQKTKEQINNAYGCELTYQVNELAEKALKAASKITGYSPDQLKKLKKNYIIRWRNIIIYTLVSEFDCPLTEVLEAFGQYGKDDEVIAKITMDEFESIRATEGRRHLLLPYVNQIVDYIVL